MFRTTLGSTSSRVLRGSRPSVHAPQEQHTRTGQVQLVHRLCLKDSGDQPGDETHHPAAACSNTTSDAVDATAIPDDGERSQPTSAGGQDDHRQHADGGPTDAGHAADTSTDATADAAICRSPRADDGSSRSRFNALGGADELRLAGHAGAGVPHRPRAPHPGAEPHTPLLCHHGPNATESAGHVGGELVRPRPMESLAIPATALFGADYWSTPTGVKFDKKQWSRGAAWDRALQQPLFGWMHNL